MATIALADEESEDEYHLAAECRQPDETRDEPSHSVEEHRSIFADLVLDAGSEY
jgi:hypothetical protein